MTSAKDKGRRPDGRKWWIVHRHNDVDLVEGPQMPKTENGPGLRIAKVYGPFLDEGDARERADQMRANTHRARMEGAGVV